MNSGSNPNTSAPRPVTDGDVVAARTEAGIARLVSREATEGARIEQEAVVRDIVDSLFPGRVEDLARILRAILEGASPDDAKALRRALKSRSTPADSEEPSDNELNKDWRDGGYPYRNLMQRNTYERQKYALQVELLKLQAWVRETGQKVVILFEGRDAAGKGGTIKRFMENLNPRGARVVALQKPTETERGQWYFQRYVQTLPTAGEIVLFDRSWYNRSGVERVMGFADADQVEEFFRDVPDFERMLVRSGITLVKYWFSITDEEQQMRFLMRIHDPMKQWKLSPMDLESRVRWEQYTKAKEEMFARTNIPQAPWYIVEGNDKKRARLNCIDHLLQRVPYEDVPHEEITLPDRVFNPEYERQVLPRELYVPEKY
jgi:polyphosphate kinase 2